MVVHIRIMNAGTTWFALEVTVSVLSGVNFCLCFVIFCVIIAGLSDDGSYNSNAISSAVSPFVLCSSSSSSFDQCERRVLSRVYVCTFFLLFFYFELLTTTTTNERMLYVYRRINKWPTAVRLTMTNTRRFVHANSSAFTQLTATAEEELIMKLKRLFV